VELYAYRTTLQEELPIRAQKRKRIVMRSVRRCCLVLNRIRISISTLPRNYMKIRISRNSFSGDATKNMQTVEYVANAMSIRLETMRGANWRLPHVLKVIPIKKKKCRTTCQDGIGTAAELNIHTIMGKHTHLNYTWTTPALPQSNFLPNNWPHDKKSTVRYHTLLLITGYKEYSFLSTAIQY